jgi:hypothetical protein
VTEAKFWRNALAAKHHPAQFSPEVIDILRHLLTYMAPLPVHDPFAGPGVRLGRLCDELDLIFTGTEIEPEFIVDPRVHEDDSTRAWSYPGTHPDQRPGAFRIVTSPVYPNGMADHFNAQDDSKRHTYRQGLANINGYDRELHEANMGRYTARAGKKALTLHLDIAERCVRHWAAAKAPVILNVSDFIVAGERFELVTQWWQLLQDHGYTIVRSIEVQTRRQRHGANGDLRVDHETIVIAEPSR